MFAKGWPGRLAGQDDLGALFEAHPAVASIPCGTMHAHMASSGEGVSPRKNWTLSRTEVDARRRAVFPKPPQKRGAA